ncbi:hypothetical protein IQ241_14375 [Romeria aff. gracilis LEGE 07310]|uniref:Nucleotidyltransferase family protein n=1 Tax=Vasconcelosia minhoensis LEGE 07310 TaxID=915328 RepID=A0A8J7AWG8_9CYAN|nr:hypothetical protein [Romeria gracilis]MBE9078468.1 hypothetical protein [Romeria aff. gracilis LEGE 07310]
MTIQLQLKPPLGYRPQAEDISSAADLLDFYLLRQRTGLERLQMAASLMRGARALSLQCLRRQFGDLSPPSFARKLAEAWLQEDCPTNYIPDGSEMTWIQDSTELATQLHGIFTSANIPYYITGGVAAIVYGEPRTTRDLDVVISVSSDDLNRLAAVLEESGFYVPGVEDGGMGQMQTLQITQIETISRADLMIAGTDAYERLKFERRQRCPFPGGTEVYVASAEDIILSKLRWGQQSQSEKQRRDVLGVLKIQQERLDYAYLVRLAAQLDLSDVLASAAREAGVQGLMTTEI